MKIRSRTIVSLLITIMIVFSGCSQDKNENIVTEKQEIQHNVSVVYINVGRADSILVMVDEKAWLIDTGLKESVDQIKTVLEKYNIEELQGVFLTHTHKDHIGGLEQLSKAYKINQLYSATISMNKKNGENKIDNLAKKCELSQTKLNAGDSVPIADELSFQVFGPVEYNEEDDNDNSLVLQLRVNGRTFLFVGDMQFAEEKTLLSEGVDLSADILKVGNHGNKDATSEEFAKAVSPDVAIISTDTQEDSNSANKRVRKLFDTTYITEDYMYGILVTVDSDGKIHVSEA